MNTDIYQRVTDQIVAELEKGVCPWRKPWNAEHAAGRITRPLRANGIAYRGINVLMLWAAATERGYAAPLWLTYKQAQELGAQVRKGEKGSLVVYANTITRTEQDEATGEDLERDIPFMKGYADQRVDNLRYQADRQRNARAIQNPRQDIAPLRVGSERKRPARRFGGGHEVGIQNRMMRRNPGRQQGQRRQGADQARANDEARVLSELGAPLHEYRILGSTKE